MELEEGELAQRLAAFCAERLPGREQAQVVELRRISDGWETDVYAFTLTQQAEREELILRLYPGADARDKSAREYDTLTKLHAADYPVPQVFTLEQEAAVLGKPFMIMQKINGQSLGRVFDRAPLEKKGELLRLFCQLQVQLHNLDWRPFAPDEPVYRTGDPAQVLTRNLAWWQSFYQRCDCPEFDPLFAWFHAQAPTIRWERLSVTHGDYHGNNILLQDDGRAFVIDWGLVEVSDFRFDLAWTLLLSSTYGNPQAREMILQEYERVWGRPVEKIGPFEAMAAARRLFSILASVRGGATRLGMRAGAEKVMLGNTTHLRALYTLLQERSGLRLPGVEAWLATLL